MAKEITIAAQLVARKGNFSFTRQTNRQVDMTGDGGGNPGKLNIGTGDTVVTFTGLTTPRYCWIENLDGTNTVDVGPESGGAIVDLITLKPGEFAVLPLHASAVLRLQASGADTPVLVEALEA